MRRLHSKAVDELGLLLEGLWEFRQREGKALPECTAVVLAYLARQPAESALLADVQERLDLSAWEVGRGCLAIADADLLRITRTAEDGRVKRLTLTANGYRLIDRFLKLNKQQGR